MKMIKIYISIVHKDPNLNHLVIFNLLKLWYAPIFILLMHLEFLTSCLNYASHWNNGLQPQLIKNGHTHKVKVNLFS